MLLEWPWWKTNEGLMVHINTNGRVWVTVQSGLGILFLIQALCIYLHCLSPKTNEKQYYGQVSVLSHFLFQFYAEYIL